MLKARLPGRGRVTDSVSATGKQTCPVHLSPPGLATSRQLCWRGAPNLPISETSVFENAERAMNILSYA